MWKCENFRTLLVVRGTVWPWHHNTLHNTSHILYELHFISSIKWTVCKSRFFQSISSFPHSLNYTEEIIPLCSWDYRSGLGVTDHSCKPHCMMWRVLGPWWRWQHVKKLECEGGGGVKWKPTAVDNSWVEIHNFKYLVWIFSLIT